MIEFIELIKKVPLLFESLLVVLVPSGKQVYADTLLNDTDVSKEQVLVASVSNTPELTSNIVTEDKNLTNDSLIKVENNNEYLLVVKASDSACRNYDVAKEGLDNAIQVYNEEQELLKQLEEAKSAAKKREIAKQLEEQYNLTVELSSETNGDVWAIANSLVGTPGDCFYICQLFIQAYTGQWRSFGDVYQTDSPSPGDLIYYSDGGIGYEHWAIYLGGDSALQGNFNGTTVIGNVYLNNASSPIFYKLP